MVVGVIYLLSTLVVCDVVLRSEGRINCPKLAIVSTVNLHIFCLKGIPTLLIKDSATWKWPVTYCGNLKKIASLFGYAWANYGLNIKRITSIMCQKLPDALCIPVSIRMSQRSP